MTLIKINPTADFIEINTILRIKQISYSVGQENCEIILSVINGFIDLTSFADQQTKIAIFCLDFVKLKRFQEKLA